MLGWKEFEMEVVRDSADNAIIICSIENIDPMGVHTGDSMTVAPALTLTDKEYQRMRTASIAVLREIGVETGGSNVQFALNPADGRMVIIEMNPRVSRSSALASKATGFPIAKVAAKLAVGYTLDELTNDITQVTPASFEPTIDYVVTKIPRFAFEKFPGADPTPDHLDEIGGRSDGHRPHLRGDRLQKGVALAGNRPHRPRRRSTLPGATRTIRAALGPAHAGPSARRGTGDLRLGISESPNSRASPATIPGSWARSPKSCASNACDAAFRPADGATGLLRLKSMGFSDARLATLAKERSDVRAALRANLGVRPVFKRIDTCAAEFAALTPYMYSTYESPVGGEVECEARPTEKTEDHHPRRRSQPHRPGHRIRLLLLPRRRSRCRRRGSRPSWSTAIRRPCRPTTTPPTGSISSR